MSYKKVVVFTPMEILEEITYDTSELHDDILERMFDDRVFEEYNHQMKSNDLAIFGIYKHLLHTRAAFLAYNIGFSVSYETENHVMLYISDFITEETIRYVLNNYQKRRDYLYFSLFVTNDEQEKIYYEVETDEQKNYEMVYEELLQTLHTKKALQCVKKGR